MTPGSSPVVATRRGGGVTPGRAWTHLEGDPEKWSAGFNPHFTVVQETDDYIVVDKPAPLQVHPSKPGNPPTLLDGLEALLAYEIVNGARLSIINRLDRETSGLTLVAKHPSAARLFGRAMERRMAEKDYLALVWGWPADDEFTIDGPLRRLGEIQPSPVYVKQTVHPDGAPSTTAFRVLRRFEKETTAGSRFSLIHCLPRTGRMHQIRVHLSHAGFPIVGDKIYGPGDDCYLQFMETDWTPDLARRLLLPRHALHSCRLRLTPPDTPPLEWQIPLAPDLLAWMGEAPGGAPSLTPPPLAASSISWSPAQSPVSSPPMDRTETTDDLPTPGFPGGHLNV